MKARTLTGLLLLIIISSWSGTIKAQESSFTYICPMDGSENLNPEQNIILKYPPGIEIGSFDPGMINITGSISGNVCFEYLFNKEEDVLLLEPAAPFAPGETVRVNYSGGLSGRDGKSLIPLEFHFTILDFDRDELYRRMKPEQPDYDDQAIEFTGKLPARTMQDNNLPPDYPPPTMINYDQPDDRYFFYNTVCRNGNLPWKSYITIVDAQGVPVYYNKSEFVRHNFSMLPNGLLCYAISTLPNGPREKYFIMDSTYTVIDSVNTGNGYILDSHDMLLLENGHYLVMSYDPQPVDMSQVVPGGDPEAIVTGLVIQEVDNDENVFFQWRSWDHFEITDATDDIDLTAPEIDYVHGNAFEIDVDGNILLSSRNLDEITKINFNNGEVIWRFGLNCENNMFQIFNDPVGFSHQHDIRKRGNGRYTIYDNGNLNTPQVSRALEYELDQTLLIANLEWSYKHPTNIYASSTGSFRVLEGNHRVIGWGGTWPIAATVVDQNGTMLQQMFLPDFVNTYRVLKYEWENAVMKTRDKLSLGNYAGYDDWKYNRIYIFNTCDRVVTITSTYNENDAFEVKTELPISIFPGFYKYIEIGFKPGMQGDYSDRFTLNFDNSDNSERIASQFDILAYYDEDVPSVHFTPGYDSTDVHPNSEISILFSEPVKKLLGGEVQNSDIPFLVELKETFNDGESVPFTGTINNDKTLITIYPDESLEENKQYFIKLLGNLLVDEDENAISLNEESYFTTGIMTDLPEIRETDMSVFPNPSNGIVTITFNDEGSRDISIHNASGKLLRSYNSNRSRLEVDLSDHPAGIYYIQSISKTTGRTRVHKLVRY